MIKRIILAISILLSFQSFAGKNYQLKLKVLSMATGKVLEGIKISTSTKDKIVEIGRTNANGEIVIKDLRAKYFQIIMEDPYDYHRKDIFFYLNHDRVDEEESFGLRLNPLQEDAFFEALDSQYTDTMTTITEADKEKFVESNPVDGIAVFQRHIATNVEYPQDAIEKHMKGKVYISFVVQADGTLTHAKVERGICPSLDKEAYRLVRYSGKWKPATLNGTPIPTKMRVPINFTLN